MFPEEVLHAHGAVGGRRSRHPREEIRRARDFDDTGTLPVGAWLHEFCEGLIARGLHKKVRHGLQHAL